MPTPPGRPPRAGTSSAAFGRAEFAAEFLRRNSAYRAERSQMQKRIADGTVARSAVETAFGRRWGLSFRLHTG